MDEAMKRSLYDRITAVHPALMRRLHDDATITSSERHMILTFYYNVVCIIFQESMSRYISEKAINDE